MKFLVFLALILFAANSYNLWDNWHNVPTTWVASPSNAFSTTSWGLSGYTRNGPSSPHPSGMFSNYTQTFTQYLYWQNSNPNVIIMCGPKYYLYSNTQCKVNPYFQASGMTTYCQPNYYNNPTIPSVCDQTNLINPSVPCCYDGSSFTKTFTSMDPYSAPLW